MNHPTPFAKRRTTGLIAAIMVAGATWPIGSALAQSPGAELGTLLYSPAERQALIRARTAPVGATVPSLTAAPQSTRLSGVVSRGQGKSTAWINDAPVEQGQDAKSKILGTEVLVDGQRLRVGQSINALTGERADVVAPGAVRKGPSR